MIRKQSGGGLTERQTHSQSTQSLWHMTQTVIPSSPRRRVLAKKLPHLETARCPFTKVDPVMENELNQPHRRIPTEHTESPHQQFGGRQLQRCNTMRKSAQSCSFPDNNFQDILQVYMDKQKKAAKKHHSELSRLEDIDTYTKEFTQMLNSDPELSARLGDSHEMRGVAKALINLAYGTKLEYHYEAIRMQHASMNIPAALFDKFKYYYLLQLKKMKIPIDQMFRCAQVVEGFRGAILNSCENKLKDNLKDITKDMYGNIYADFHLSSLFKGIKIEDQVSKFSNIFGFIMNTQEQTTHMFDNLRDYHVKFNITSTQYSLFKYYMAQALQNANLGSETFYSIMESADAYKTAIINQESVRELIDKFVGYNNFITEFGRACIQDPFLNKHFVQKFTTEQFPIHCKYIFQHILQRHNNCFVLTDLKNIHQHCMILPKVFEQIKWKAMQMILKLNPHQVVIQDFEEEWEIIEPYITGQPLPVDIYNGMQPIYDALPALCEDMAADYEFVMLYEGAEVQMLENLRRKFTFMLSGRKYYKKSDIQAIHQGLNITSEMFDDFVDKCSKQFDPWLIEYIANWKHLIIM